MYEFDQDTALTAEGDAGAPCRVYRGVLTARWNIGQVPNGGYVMSVALNGLTKTLSDKDPLTATCHFLRPAEPGPVEVRTEVLKIGRTFATGTARLWQGGTERAFLVATFGDLSKSDTGIRHVDAAPPEVPSPDTPAVPRPAFQPPAIAERLDVLLATETIPFVRGEKGETVFRGRVRFKDGRLADVLSLALFADSMPPPIFNAIGMGWVPTLELSVHFRARPRGDWLRCRFSTRFAFGGLLEEDGELWDDEGRLVALSRQLAAMPRTS